MCESPEFQFMDRPAPWRSRRPRKGPDFAEITRQFLPRCAAVGGTIDLATDAAGIHEVRIRGMDGEVPHRAVGATWHLRRMPTCAAVKRTCDQSGRARRSITGAQQ